MCLGGLVKKWTDKGVSIHLEKMRLTASDREALMRLNVANQILVNTPEALKKRFSLVKGAKRDAAMMAAKSHRLLEQIIDTIPDEQLPIYARMLRGAQYWIGVRKPGDTAGTGDDSKFGMWVPYSLLNQIMAGCRDHCDMCSLDKGQRRACPLRKAIDTIPNDVPRREDGDCPYFIL